MRVSPAPAVTEPRARRLRQNIATGVLGNVVYAAGQLGIVAMLARTASTREVGDFMMALAIAGPAFAFTTLKLRQVQATDVAQQYAYGHYLALRILTAGLAMAGVACAAVLLPLRWQAAAILVAVALLKGCESIMDICYGAMQQREQLQLVARSLAVRGLAGLALFASVMLLTGWVVLATTALVLLAAVLVGVETRRLRWLGLDVRPRVEYRVLCRMLVTALPLGVTLAVASLLVNVPRYFLGAAHGTDDVGVYATLAYVLTVGNTVVSAIAASTSPRLATYYQRGQSVAFRRLLARTVVLGATLGLMGLAAAPLLGPPILRLIFGAAYARNTDVLMVLILASVIDYASVFVGTSLDAIRVFAVQLPVHLVALVAVTVTSLFAVPVMGMMGAALAVLAGAIVKGAQQVVVYVRVVRPVLAGPLPRRSGATRR